MRIFHEMNEFWCKISYRVNGWPLNWHGMDWLTFLIFYWEVKNDPQIFESKKLEFVFIKIIETAETSLICLLPFIFGNR